MGRGARRFHTLRVSERRYEDRLRSWGGRGAALAPNSPPVPPPHFFAKRHAMGCGCSKRKDGQPRLNVGMCGAGDRDRIYAGRAQSRALRQLAQSGWFEWESDMVALLE